MTKRFFALLMAVVMVLALSVPAFADEVPAGKKTITVNSMDARTYDVYQIFKADFAEDEKGNEVLSNIVWGANAKLPNGAKIGDSVAKEVLEELAEVASSKDDQEKLAVIEKYVNLDSTAVATVDKSNSATVDTGYYLLKDKGAKQQDGSFKVPETEEISEYIVEIVNDVTVSPKRSTTTTDKSVGDVNDTESKSITWDDSADHDIGDAVPFKLTAVISEDYANYPKYYFAFHDKQSGGLTFNADSVHVYVGEDESKKEITSYFTVKTSDLTDGCTFELICNDLKEIKEDDTALISAKSIITAEYTSTLNTEAVIGSKGNLNEMYGEYSNDPNSEQKGKTVPDTVIVFTYEFDGTKYANEAVAGNELKGAGFTVYKNVVTTDGSKTWIPVGEEVVNTDGATFEWPGLDDGEYKISETTTPAGYNTMADITFTITATHDEETGLISLVVNPADAFKVEMVADDTPTGYISTDLVNKQGSVLPETGGIGTTIFYVVGAVLVVGAAVILFAKKKVEE